MKKWSWLIPAVSGIILFYGAVSGGASYLPPAQWWAIDGTINPIFELRLVRALGAAVIGASLALSGLIFQAVLRNPLAEPYILGVSGGAGLGVALLIILGGWGSILTLPIGALLGGLGALFIVLQLAGWGRRGSESLLLSGVIVSTLAGSCLMYLVSNADRDELAGVTWWMLGDLQGGNSMLLAINAGILILSLAVLRSQARAINALTLGESEAWNLGVSPQNLTLLLVIIGALLAALPVAYAGIIGFVGLIVPHLVRRIYGCDHVKTVGLAPWWGANFLLLADLLCRLPCAEKELPIGVLTALIGGPLFLYLLNRRKTYGA